MRDLIDLAQAEAAKDFNIFRSADGEAGNYTPLDFGQTVMSPEFKDGAGRPNKVRFKVDAGAISDEYTLAYVWSGNEVTWTLVPFLILGSLFVPGNKIGSGDMETAVRNHRLAIGYSGAERYNNARAQQYGQRAHRSYRRVRGHDVLIER